MYIKAHNFRFDFEIPSIENNNENGRSEDASGTLMLCVDKFK